MPAVTEPFAPSPDACPRCGEPVGCGIASAQPCWCSLRPTLDAATRAALAQRYEGCLCAGCLSSVATWLPRRDADADAAAT